jgi:hypothetical protein
MAESAAPVTVSTSLFMMAISDVAERQSVLWRKT